MANTFLELAKTLLGFSAYTPPAPTLSTLDLDDPIVKQAREMAGGGLAPPPVTHLRWYPKDLEVAQVSADGGDLMMAAQLFRSMRSDGTVSGLLGVRAAGLLRLPRNFTGDDRMVEVLKTRSHAQELFDSTFPPSEVQALEEDGVMLGIGVAEMVPVPGRRNPVMIRLEPEFLKYNWKDNRWFYRSIAGLIPITPGDGRWILHVPGGRMSPWQKGAWIPCAEAWINKRHAKLNRFNYGGKLANPARVIKSPIGASEDQRYGSLAKLAAWGLNTVFELPVGWDAALLESKGEGHQVWKDDIADDNDDIKMAIAGQIVTSDGGTGFDKGDLFKMIRSDIVQTDGDKLAHTFNTQALPYLTAVLIGPEALADPGAVKWDTTPPQDRQREATLIMTGADAIQRLTAAVKPAGYEVMTAELALRLGLPIVKAAAQATPVAKLDIAPTDLAKSIRVREIRASRELPPLGDERDELTVAELDALIAAKAAAAQAVPAQAEPEEDEPKEAV